MVVGRRKDLNSEGGEERGDILGGSEERAWHGMDCPSYVCI
jgi:hypothetical protein